MAGVVSRARIDKEVKAWAVVSGGVPLIFASIENAANTTSEDSSVGRVATAALAG
jgi:hypothetical protein